MTRNGNINRLRHGGRASYRLILGELPRPLERVKRNARRYRRDLEAAVDERHGEISVLHAHSIDSAVAAETHCQVCRWLLNQRLDKMSVSDIVTCSREIMRAKETRDRAVRQLGLDAATGQSAIDALYSTPHIAQDERGGGGAVSESPTQPDATDGNIDDSDGGQNHENPNATEGDT